MRRLDLGLGLGLGAGAAVLALLGIYTARAGQGGETRRVLSFAGTLRGAQAGKAVKLEFTFSKNRGEVCPAPAQTPVLRPTGDPYLFQTEIPIEHCPGGFF